MALTIYLNGQYVPYEQASIPIEDRSFLLADGIYEVVRVYGGRPFRLDAHLSRLARSAREIRLTEPDRAELERACLKLLQINQLSCATVYIQVSRGAYAPRTHAFPAGSTHPTVLVIARAYAGSPDQQANGVPVISVPDQRWARCDIKSVSLLPNTLAKQAAVEAGAYEAILVKDGYAIEGSSSNFMAVLDGEIRTYPLCNYILGGITRAVILELAQNLGFPIREEGIPVVALSRCSEMWVTSTTSEVMPITSYDGRHVGSGRPGPVAVALQAEFSKLI